MVEASIVLKIAARPVAHLELPNVKESSRERGLKTAVDLLGKPKKAPRGPNRTRRWVPGTSKTPSGTLLDLPWRPRGTLDRLEEARSAIRPARATKIEHKPW